MAPSITTSDWAAWSDNRPGLSTATKRALAGELGPLHSTSSAGVGEARLQPSRLGIGAIRALERAAAHGEVFTDDESRARHAGGQALADLLRRRGGDASAAPDGVVVVNDASEVFGILAAAAVHRVAVVPWGGGTSVVGGLDPISGGHQAVIALDLSGLNRLLDVDPVSLIATFEPGIRTPDAEAALALHGLTLGHLPQSYERATLGGYVVTRSAGQASSGIGRIDDLLVGAKLTTPEGVLDLRPMPSSAAGPDLKRLILGSEGTLGILTEVTLRVRAIPATRRYEAWVAPSWARGQDALREIAQGDLLPTVIRLSDPTETRLSLVLGSTPKWQQRALAAYLRVRAIKEGCLVIVGWEGDRREVAIRRSVTGRALKAHGAIPIGGRAGESWRRHRFSGPSTRDSLLDAGVIVETLETAALWSKLAEVEHAVRSSLARSIPGCRVGCHVSHLYPTGASLYFTILFNANSERPKSKRSKEKSIDLDIIDRWLAAKADVTAAIVAAGGTASHHHAVGSAHRDQAVTDLGGEVGERILRAIKREIDPSGICNPGKLMTNRP